VRQHCNIIFLCSFIFTYISSQVLQNLYHFTTGLAKNWKLKSHLPNYINTNGIPPMLRYCISDKHKHRQQHKYETECIPSISERCKILFAMSVGSLCSVWFPVHLAKITAQVRQCVVVTVAWSPTYIASV